MKEKSDDISMTMRIDDSRLRGLTHDLYERVKELNCLYSISRVMENHDYSIDEVLTHVADLIPPAWQYPEITGARITVNSRYYQTDNFKETPWEQKEPIIVDGKEFGILEVSYLEERPTAFDGPFLKEERYLIHVIAERLGNKIKYQAAESDLQVLYGREKRLRKRLQKEAADRVDFNRKLFHELKTPLTSLMATVQYLTLLEHNKGTESNKVASLAWEGASRLNNRIEELHDVTKGEIGALKVKLKSVDLSGLLSSTVDETLAFTQEHGIAINLELEQDLPEVAADPERLRQVLLNLINNACKYASEGKRVIIKAGRDSEKSVKIEVRDFGPGISKYKQRALFKPGYQVSHGKESPGGLGIGLTLCKMLISLQGGKIWVESRPGEGSSFFFTLLIAEKRDNS